MSLDELIAAMLTQHVFVRRPTDPKPAEGRYVIASESEYAPGGFSVCVSDWHWVITGAVKRALEQLGFEVQHALGDHRMEAWPGRGESAPG